MFILCVKEADWGIMALVAYFALVFRMVHHIFPHVPCTATPLSKQHWAFVPSISGHFLDCGGWVPTQPRHQNLLRQLA